MDSVDYAQDTKDTAPSNRRRAGRSGAARTARQRARIEDVYPTLDCGRYAVKRVEGDVIEVWADIIMDGHDLARAVVRFAHAEDRQWTTAPMALVDNDRWCGRFGVDRIGLWRFTIEAWPDHFATWLRDVEKKRAAGFDVTLEIEEGRLLVARAVNLAKGERARLLAQVLERMAGAEASERLALLLTSDLAITMADCVDPDEVTKLASAREIVVDRAEARFAAWYEMFPRSQGTDPTKSATFEDCARRLPDIRDMGFDTVYLVPIHPIGKTNRKGRHNSLTAAAGDPGSPYAIGSEAGGHDAIEPMLGTLEDFRAFVAAARALDMEVALDFAVQCSPDHPWLSEHPDWFRKRPDGSIAYAENPPKKYEDIVPVDFHTADAEALWIALRDVVLFWIDQGIRVFRVDNPHTKPFAFWEWMIRSVKERHPDVIFLSEAFTRPKIMKTLAKLGFSQSYTYFTWRNEKQELIDYMVELSQDWPKEYLRPHFFTNTPDILPFFLQTSGRPGFVIRATLAATLSPLYGIYNGFELCEAEAVPGKEEYADSEKYRFRTWDWDRPGNIKAELRALNRIRHENPALQHLSNLRFHRADNDHILFYSKATADRRNIVFVAVNLDPANVQEAHIEMPWALYGLPEDQPIALDDLLLGHDWVWRGVWQRLRLDPSVNPVAIFRVRPIDPGAR